MSTLVFLEHHGDELLKGSLGVLSKAATLGDAEVAGVVIGSGVRALADQVGEYLAFFLALQIGAGRGRGQVELRRIARMLGHVVRPSWLPIPL